MADLSDQRCPYLGLRDDPYTWYAFSSADNTCHRPGKPLTIPLDHQYSACLTDEHSACPVFQLEDDNKAALSKRAGRLLYKKRISTTKSRVVLVVVTAIALIGTVLGLSEAPILLPNLLTVATHTLTPAPTSTNTLTASASPTDTPSPTLTPIPSPSPTPFVFEAIVAFDSNLRSAPNVRSDILTQIPAGTTVFILGRDQTSRWVFIRTPRGREGWLAITQFLNIADVSTFPIAPPLMTQAASATP